MKNFSLKTYAIALAFILLLSAFACSGGEQKAETPAPNEQQAQTTDEPADEPTAEPATEPSAEPSPEPTVEPTADPAAEPPAVPTAVPTAMPLDGPSTDEEKQYAEAAYRFVEQIGRIHNKHFSSENTTVGEFDWLSVVFQAEEPGQSIRMLGKPDGNGGYTFSMKDMTMVMLINEFREQEWRDSYSEDVWKAYERSLRGAHFVITPEDIAAAGCTATEGEEYLLAVGRCWQQKYAEFFTSLPENYPGYCYEMQPLDCSIDRYNEEQNRLQLHVGSRPEDQRAITYLYFELDEGGGFADESYPPEIYGWLVTYGYTRLEQQEDGSWVGTTSCHTMG